MGLGLNFVMVALGISPLSILFFNSSPQASLEVFPFGITAMSDFFLGSAGVFAKTLAGFESFTSTSAKMSFFIALNKSAFGPDNISVSISSWSLLSDIQPLTISFEKLL